MKKRLLAFVLLLCTVNLLAQTEGRTLKLPTKKKKGTFYVGFGYNKDWFTRSDIHFQNNSNTLNPVTGNIDSYDFVLENTKANDRPGFEDIFVTDISIPQYVYRLGYYFNDKHDMGIEISFDHIKYVVDPGQSVFVKGQIFNSPVNEVRSLEDWLRFEHSDGGNLLQLNWLKRWQLFSNPKGSLKLAAVVKPGAGIVIPRTDVTLWGERLNNRFHIAGYVVGVEAGLRAEFFKYGFFEATGKAAYANYTNVLVIGEGKANHKFGLAEVIAHLGFQFPL